jgi:choline dehydrogenase
VATVLESLSFDVVVLGGGVAGCVLAARLSEDPGRRVALVEAGPDYGPDTQDWPSTILNPRRLPRDHVWESGVDPNRFRGKILGGSSGINGCWHVWGSASDYDGWARRGGPAWSQSSLEPYRRAVVDQMRLQPPPDRELSAWGLGAVAAAESLGFRSVAVSAPSSGPGYGLPLLNAPGGVRWNAALAYLGPARSRPNLSIADRTLVDRLVVRDGRVTGVELIHAGQRRTVTAGEYLLACGTLASPAVLMRSGIGPAAHLESIGIPVVIDLPGVGENLADHPGVFVPLSGTAQLNSALAAKDAAGELYSSRVLIRAAGPFSGGDDWDLHIVPTAGYPLFGSLPAGQYEVGVSVFLVKPHSRGRVRLTSREPDVPPQIDPAFLSDPLDRDLATMRAGLHRAAELIAAQPLASLVTRDDGPPTDLDDAALRASKACYWHPVGTCAVGPASDPLAVVDGGGRVHGVENLRVVDASILPDTPAANTQLSVLTVAEMLAATLRG